MKKSNSIDEVNFSSLTQEEKDKLNKKMLNIIFHRHLTGLVDQTVPMTLEAVEITKGLHSMVNTNFIDVSNIFNNLDDVSGNSTLEKLGVKVMQLLTRKGIIDKNYLN